MRDALPRASPVSTVHFGTRREQRQIFPGEGGRGERRDLGDVVGRRHLDDVHALKPRPARRRRIACACQVNRPPISGRAGARRESRVERVDVEAQIGRRVADDLADALGGGLRAALVHRLGEQDRDPAADGPIMHRAVHRRADADLYGAPGVDQPLLDRMKKRRAVAETLAETLGPGIDMRVEMDERELRRSAPPARAAGRA